METLKKLDKRVVLTVLILIGGIAWIYYHMKNAVVAVGTLDNPDVAGQFQQYPYPNSDGSPIVIPPVNIGSSPLSLSYNFPPTRGELPVLTAPTSDACGCGGGNNCGGVSRLTFSPVVPRDVLQASADNFSGYRSQAGSQIVPTSYRG